MTTEFAYNNSKQSSTNTSPFAIIYGRELVLPNVLVDFIKDDHVTQINPLSLTLFILPIKPHFIKSQFSLYVGLKPVKKKVLFYCPRDELLRN